MSTISRWWQRLPLPWRKWRIILRVEAGDEVPNDIPLRGVVLVSAGGKATWLAFDCPCGAGHRIMLNLNPARRPSWSVKTYDPLTVLPSVDDISRSRRCHFFLHKGRIQWAQTRERALS